MNRLLTVFIWIWVTGVLLLNFISMAGFFLTMSFWEAVAKIQDTYSPFNVWTHGLNVVLLLPAIAAYFWRDRRRNKAEATNPK